MYEYIHTLNVKSDITPDFSRGWGTFCDATNSFRSSSCAGDVGSPRTGFRSTISRRENNSPHLSGFLRRAALHLTVSDSGTAKTANKTKNKAPKASNLREVQ